jgi:hypothetical protein
MAAGVGLSIALAAVSHRFVERRFRRRPNGGLSRRGAFAATVAAIAVFAIVGEVLSADEGLRVREGGFVAAADHAEHDFPTTGACGETTLGAAQARCFFGAARAGPPDLVLMGDSESVAWEAGVAQWARAHGLKGQLVSQTACPPVIGVGERDADGKAVACADHNTRVLDQVVADHRIRDLVLVARWALYDKGPDKDHPNPYLTVPNGKRDPSKFHALLTNGFTQAVGRLEAGRANDLAVFVVRSAPEFPLNPPRCAARAAMVGRDPAPCLQAPKAPMLARQTAAEAMLQAVATGHPNIHLLTPYPQLCDSTVCRAGQGGQFLYRDAYHPTATGAGRMGLGLFAGR